MKDFKIGIQLYPLREDMEKDMDATLKKVKEMGYDCVEFAGYFGHSAEEVKAMLDKYGLECVSVHQGPQLFADEGQSAVDYIKTLGAKYSAIPGHDVACLAGTEKWPETVELFTKVGKLLKENGIQQLYHNHDFEFKKFEDKCLFDWIFDTIPADYIQPQVDTCWVHYAGFEPVEYIEKYAGRMDVIHIKDYVCDNGIEFRPLGMGEENIPAILEAAKKFGVEYIIVEDETENRPPIEAVEISRKYLKSLGL